METERTEMALAIKKIADWHVLLWLHTTVDPTKDRWTNACKSIVRATEAHGLNTDGLRGIVITDAAAPNAAQRKEHELVAPRLRMLSSVIPYRTLSNAVLRPRYPG